MNLFQKSVFIFIVSQCLNVSDKVWSNPRHLVVCWRRAWWGPGRYCFWSSLSFLVSRYHYGEMISIQTNIKWILSSNDSCVAWLGGVEYIHDTGYSVHIWIQTIQTISKGFFPNMDYTECMRKYLQPCLALKRCLDVQNRLRLTGSRHVHVYRFKHLVSSPITQVRFILIWQHNRSVPMPPPLQIYFLCVASNAHATCNCLASVQPLSKE